MNIILETPFTLPSRDIQSHLGIKSGSKLESTFKVLIETVENTAKPKALYRVSYIEVRGLDSVMIEDVEFHSQAMCSNFADIGRVFPYIATCGTEVDEISFDRGDILKQYWLDAIKLALLSTIEEYLSQTIKDQYLLKNLSTMNPGSGEASIWPIDEQRPLFVLFGGPQVVEESIGVRLLDSYLMTPNMSTSGILFPSETHYYNCQLCQREDCSSRQSPFDPAFWESIHG